MIILFEAKTIDDEYQKNWTDIPREDFDKIIKLDPVTSIENNRIGPSAKQLLLPRYLEGETDFLNNLENVSDALQKYVSNRNSFPVILRNITAFPTVKDFVDYVLNGDESDFAKRVDLSDAPVKKEKESKLDQIYNKYYSDINREVFDKIIALDPETNENNIGTVAKQLLLPKYKQGEDFLSKNLDIPTAINYFNLEKDSYAQDKKSIQNFPSVEEFVKFVIAGPESSLLQGLKNNPNIQGEFNLITSTRNYEVIQPLSHAANNAISCLNERRSRGNETHAWCTGWTDDTSQWRSHSNREYIYCFMYKKDLKDRKKNYQLAIRKDNYTVYQFLDGDDKAFGEFNADARPSTKFFEDFLYANIDVLFAISTCQYLKDCPTVKKVLENVKQLDKPFEYKDYSSLHQIDNNPVLRNVIKELIVSSDNIPAEAFMGFPALKFVTLNEGLKKIGNEAFMKCISLEKIVFPESLEEIGAEAFANCLNLKGSIKIPNNVKKIGINAFRKTQVILAIDKERKEKLHIAAEDKDWFLRHYKAITVQKTEELDEEDNMFEAELPDFIILDENIPLDLARAYQKSNRAERGIQNHPESKHNEVGDKSTRYWRKGVKYDYARSNYEEISKDEAKELLRRDRYNIENLRFIIDGYVIEYEIRNGNRLYQTYWMNIPAELLDDKGLEILDKNGNPTTDSRYAIRYGDINTIIELADKIYKTDEYEHLITPETKTGKKIKVIKKDEEGNPILEPLLDKEGNPVMDKEGKPVQQYSYEIVDDTIFNRRSRGNKFHYLKTERGNDDSDYVPHQPYFNYFTKYTTVDNPDTGKHGFGGLENLSVQARNEYNWKQNSFKRYDYIRSVLNKLEKERDLYDEDEYEELHAKYESAKNTAYTEYLNAVMEFKKVKDKTILVFDEVIQNYHDRMERKLDSLQKYTTRIFNLSNELSSIQLEPAKDYKIDELKNELKVVNTEIENTEKQKAEALAQIEALKEQIERNQISINDGLNKLIDLRKSLDQVSDEAIKQKFDRIKRIEQEIASYKDELAKDFPRRYSKDVGKQSKEIDPSIQDVIAFGDDEISSSESDTQ